MTDKFVCPEPSKEAVQAYAMSTPSTINAGLRAAYAVDFPAVVRAEVELAFKAQYLNGDDLSRGERAYLAARFPEAAPEPECPCGNPDKGGVHYLDHRSPCKPTPTAAEPMVQILCGNGHVIDTVSVSAEGWAVRKCPVCDGRVESCRPTPSAPAETVRTCGHVQVGECANCLAEQLKRQSDSLRRKDGVVAAPPSEAPAKREIVDAISLPELIQHGRDIGANIVNGMPWSFTYKGCAVSHERDDLYLITTPTRTLRFALGDILGTWNDGTLSMQSDGESLGGNRPASRVAAARPEAGTATGELPKCPTCGEDLRFSVRMGLRKHECRFWMTLAEREFVRALARREVRVAPLLDKLFHLLDSAEAEAWTSPNCTLDAARRVLETP